MMSENEIRKNLIEFLQENFDIEKYKEQNNGKIIFYLSFII